MNKRIKLKKEMLYSKERGFGFVTESIRDSEEFLKIPELNCGFDILYWYMDREITTIVEEDYGCYAKGCLGNGSKEEVSVPLFFKADVEAEGNYLVTIQGKAGAEGVKSLTLFGGRRHLYFHEISLEKEEEFIYSFLVNVSDIIPRGYTIPYQDRSIDFAILGEGFYLSEVRIESSEVKTIFLAGDSTVTDQPSGYPYLPSACYSGWGQELTSYLSTDIAVSNHAHSGLTTESFREEGHLKILYRLAKPGDYVFFQFGHNDQKLEHLKAYGGYRDNLIRYVKECRNKELIPVFITPIARNTWREEGKQYIDLLAQYEKVCLELGKEYEVPVLNLHERSMTFIKEQGLEKAKKYFYPGDYTHSNDYGGYLFASFVAQELKKIVELVPYLKENQSPWIPSEELCLPNKPSDPVYEVPPEHAAGYQIPFSGVFAKSPADVTKELEFLCRFSAAEE